MSELKILRSCDIENEIRVALDDYFTVYCRPLPSKFSTPCLLVTATGGSSENTIDSFTVNISARATEDAVASEYLRNALGALEEMTKKQVGALRFIQINSLASWGNDPVRPDLKLCTATVIVTAHREQITLS